MLHDYLNFNAEQARKDAYFSATIDQIVAENVEVGYLILAGLQSCWCDFIDLQEVFRVVSEKTIDKKTKDHEGIN